MHGNGMGTTCALGECAGITRQLSRSVTPVVIDSSSRIRNETDARLAKRVGMSGKTYEKGKALRATTYGGFGDRATRSGMERPGQIFPPAGKRRGNDKFANLNLFRRILRNKKE